jgi:hypothetical protein
MLDPENPPQELIDALNTILNAAKKAGKQAGIYAGMSLSLMVMDYS